MPTHPHAKSALNQLGPSQLGPSQVAPRQVGPGQLDPYMENGMTEVFVFLSRLVFNRVAYQKTDTHHPKHIFGVEVTEILKW